MNVVERLAQLSVELDKARADKREAEREIAETIVKAVGESSMVNMATGNRKEAPADLVELCNDMTELFGRKDSNLVWSAIVTLISHLSNNLTIRGKAEILSEITKAVEEG